MQLKTVYKKCAPFILQQMYKYLYNWLNVQQLD